MRKIFFFFSLFALGWSVRNCNQCLMVTENIKRTIKRNISWLRAQIKFCQAQTRQISHLVHQPWIINYYILQLKIWPAYLAQLYKTTWIRYREIKACTAIHFYNCHPWTIWKSCFLLSLDKLWLHFRTFQFIIVHIGKKSLRVSYFFFFFLRELFLLSSVRDGVLEFKTRFVARGHDCFYGNSNTNLYYLWDVLRVLSALLLFFVFSLLFFHKSVSFATSQVHMSKWSVFPPPLKVHPVNIVHDFRLRAKSHCILSTPLAVHRSS